MNYYPRFPGHYVAKTLHLSMEQDGAYSRLLDWVYLNERAVPHDARYAIARAMTASERRAVDAVLAEFFTRDGDAWANDRAAAEIAAAQPKIAAARENGRKGGRPRKEPSKNPLGFSRDTQQEPSAKAPQSPIPITPPIEDVHTPSPTAGGWGQFEGHANPVATPNPAAAHAIALTRAGFSCTSMNADLVAFVADGGTVDHLIQLAGMPEFAGKKSTYLLRAARRELAEPARAIAIPAANGGAHASPRKLSAVEQVRAAQDRSRDDGFIAGESRRVG